MGSFLVQAIRKNSTKATRHVKILYRGMSIFERIMIEMYDRYLILFINLNERNEKMFEKTGINQNKFIDPAIICLIIHLLFHQK